MPCVGIYYTEGFEYIPLAFQLQAIQFPYLMIDIFGRSSIYFTPLHHLSIISPPSVLPVATFESHISRILPRSLMI